MTTSATLIEETVLLSSIIAEEMCAAIKCFEELGFNNIIASRHKVLTELRV